MIGLAALVMLGILAALGLGFAISWWWLRPRPGLMPLAGPHPSAEATAEPAAVAKRHGGTRGQMLGGALALIATRALDSLAGPAPTSPSGPETAGGRQSMGGADPYPLHLAA